MPNWRSTKPLLRPSNAELLLRRLPSALLRMLLLLLAFRADAQTTSFIHFGVEQGLSQSQVQTLAQDDEGNLWIGTLAGLSKYNGREFLNYSRKDGLAEDWITCSYKDTSGDLWFGHWAGGVSRYNRSSRTFESLDLEEYTRFKTVTSIIRDVHGYYWIATEGSGIFIYNPGKNQMSALSLEDGLPSDNVYALCTDGNSNIWISTDKGLCVYDQSSDVASPSSFYKLNVSNGLPSNMLTALQPVGKNEMWVGSADAGVIVLMLPEGFTAKTTGALSNRMRNIRQENGLGSNFVETICADARGYVWVGTTGGGVTKIMPSASKDRQEALSKAILKNYSTRQGLNYFNVKTVLQDREGNVWIGTDVGLNQYRGERFQLFDRQDGLVNDIVWAVCTDRKGNMWLGTNDGLTKLSFYTQPGTGEVKFVSKNYGTADGLGSNVVLSLFEDAQGTLWCGTGFGGVSKLPAGSERFETYTSQDGLANDVVYAINSDTKGNLWFGTKEGASRFDPVTKTFRNYTTADGLGGNHVYRIFRDSKGQLWFGALGGYLSVYDGSSFRKYDESRGVVHRFILCINEDKKHNIWFGAYGGGLYMFDGKTFRNFSARNGMTTDSPYAILPDDEDNIWIGNSRGLDRFHPADSSFTHFGRSEGFLGVEVNPNAACVDNNKNLWFGTIMGAVKFDPKENRKNEVEPLTQLTGLRVFMKDAPFPEDARFSYDQNHLTFRFVGVSLTSPGKVMYQYMLEGFDKDWSPGLSPLNEAVYSNIPPGEYTFMVRAVNNDGMINKEPVRYKFFVKPPFWQTAVFYFIAAAFIVFCIYGFDKMRTRNLKRQKKVLEDQVEQRTLELALKNEELAQKNKEVTDSIRYAKRLQDAMMAPLRDIKRALPDSFLLYKPKDIVSGDFYYFRHVQQQGRELALLAAVDCTGHGVPGAFMSVVTNELLDEAVRGNEASAPSKILDRLNRLISEKLRQTFGDIRIRDGVDIALCLLDLKTLELQYAGAFNPLYHFSEKQFTEYKPDKIAIGSYSDDPSRSYTTQTIQLKPGDTFYIFSDGYADQFGGPEGKKFKSARLRALLLSIQEKEMSDQGRALENAIEEWRGSLEQVDDMLVIGVRV